MSTHFHGNLVFSCQLGLVNPRCPRTHGPGGIHQSHLDVLCVQEFKLPELKVKPESPEEAKIGQLIAENLVEDGATLQMGKTP